MSRGRLHSVYRLSPFSAPGETEYGDLIFVRTISDKSRLRSVCNVTVDDIRLLMWPN